MRVLAVRADSPVDNLSFIDQETSVITGREAGCVTDGAVNVLGFTTASTDDVVVIITDPALIERGRSRWLDSSDDTLL